jgi:heme/copper-type cytochrome/quinol oxidase subunit 2
LTTTSPPEIWQAVRSRCAGVIKGENMTRTRHVAVASVTLAATALLAGCGGTKTDHLSADDGPLASGNGITPTKLAVHKGHNVEIKVTNTAKDKQHGFSIDDFGVKQVIDPGKTSTVKFKASKAGTYRVYCQIHPTHGASELTVS